MRVAAWILAAWLCGIGAATAAEPEVMFHDAFDGKLADGWTWLRENPAAWRIRDQGLEIRVEPGVADTVKNALLRPVPDGAGGPLAVEVTVSNLAKPSRQFEQVGITWYVGGKPVFKLVKELIDGRTYVIPGRKPVDDVPIRLRLVVDGRRWTAQYRPEGETEFQTAAEGQLPAASDDQVSLQCYQGPDDAEHWMRFEDFRILRLAR